MTKGGLARSDSGNFVLTDIRFKLAPPRWTSSSPSRYKPNTYEQGPLRSTSALDDNPGTG